MTRFVRCFRAASIALVMACLVLVPGVALAQFKSTRAPTLSVGTDTMETPTAVTGTFQCSKGGGNETISFTVAGFTDIGPLGSTYTFTILKAGVEKATGTSLTHIITLAGAAVDDRLATTWTITVRAGLSQWTGGTASKSAACVSASNNSGTL